MCGLFEEMNSAYFTDSVHQNFKSMWFDIA